MQIDSIELAIQGDRNERTTDAAELPKLRGKIISVRVDPDNSRINVVFRILLTGMLKSCVGPVIGNCRASDDIIG